MRSTARNPGRRRGFTLVEVAFAIAVIVVAVSGLLGALVGSSALGRVARETALAQQAARQQLELVLSAPFAETFAAFNASADDDGGLSVAAPGATFAVPGLSLAPGDAACGAIEFPTVDNAGVLQLREDVVDTPLGMPRDLDGDGAVDATDHSADYRLLPVRVRVRWQGVSGVRDLELESILCAR
jgi:prepilin-type N-terminal cleavage/methylation domain-containing protein